MWAPGGKKILCRIYVPCDKTHSFYGMVSSFPCSPLKAIRYHDLWPQLVWRDVYFFCTKKVKMVWKLCWRGIFIPLPLKSCMQLDCPLFLGILPLFFWQNICGFHSIFKILYFDVKGHVETPKIRHFFACGEVKCSSPLCGWICVYFSRFTLTLKSLCLPFILKKFSFLQYLFLDVWLDGKFFTNLLSSCSVIGLSLSVLQSGAIPLL